MKYKFQFIGLVCVCIFWFFVSIPFLGSAFIPTHDGEFHIIRIYEFSKMLNDGHLFPRWAPGLNSEYGLPLFIFHYPFPNYVGSFLNFMGYSFIDSFKIALVLGYLMALVGCYVFLSKQTDSVRATMATIVFGTVPYWFVDISIRGSIGEVWALGWSMVAFASIVWQKKVMVGISIALLCLSHNIMTMLAIPVLFGYIWLTNKHLIVQLVLGIASSFYFWIPALVESRFMVGLNTSTFSDHFPELFQLIIPSWGSGFSGPGAGGTEMSHQIGIIPLIIMMFSVVIMFRNKLNQSILPFYFFCIALIACFLMTNISMPIWTIITPLQLTQYPWRLLSLIVLSTPMLALFVMERLKYWMIIVLAFSSVVLTSSYMRPVLYEPRIDDYYIRNKNFTGGTSSMGNSFSTIWTPWKQERPESRIGVLSGQGIVAELVSTSITDEFTYISQGTSSIEIHRLYYPGWKVFIDKEEIPVNYENGTLQVTVPDGTHTIKAVFDETALRYSSNIISILAFLLLFMSNWFNLPFVSKKKNI